MNVMRKYLFVVLVFIAVGFVAAPASAMVNPAAGYCEALGYRFADTVAPDGSMTGSCILPGNQSVDAWQFLEGNVSPESGYCARQGLAMKTIQDPAICGLLGSSCAVCVKADGSTEEVTKIMKLDFREKICNDRICCDPATDTTCAIGAEATPTQKAASALSPTAMVIVIVIAGLAFIFQKKKGSGL